ncbi:MAG: ABC transporter permease [Acidimicrobiales bacterium]
MIRAFQLELSKVQRRTLAIVVGVGVFMISINVIGVAAQSATDLDNGVVTLPDATRHIVLNGFAGLLFATLMGAYLITGEEKARTMGSTFLLNPRRGEVLRAKAAVAALLGLVIGLAANASAIGAMWATLRIHGYSPTFDRSVMITLLATTAVMAVAAPWGLALGTFLRQSVIATVAIVVYTTMFETVIIEFLPRVGRYLPGGAQAAVMDDQLIPERLGRLPGGLVLLGYTVVALIAAQQYLRAREIRA